MRNMQNMVFCINFHHDDISSSLHCQLHILHIFFACFCIYTPYSYGPMIWSICKPGHSNIESNFEQYSNLLKPVAIY